MVTSYYLQSTDDLYDDLTHFPDWKDLKSLYRKWLLPSFLLIIPFFSIFVNPFLAIGLVSSYTPWKHEKTSGILVFSGGIKIEHWNKMG